MNMKKYILSIIVFAAALFAGLSVFGQEGSGNWTGAQTGRQSYLWVPNMTTGGTGNPGYDHRGFMMLPSDGAYNSSNPYDPGHRLYVYVKQGETVYWGFRRASGSNRTAQWYYDNRSHDGTDTGSLGLFPSGISGQGRLTIGSSATISTTSGPDQTQSTRGPNIAGVRTNGYNANSFTNNTGQDRAFWIELNSNSSGNQISFWDVSVYDGTTHKPGRVYSKYWSVYNGLPGSGGGANNSTSGSGNNIQITTARSNTTSFHDNFGFYVPVENTNDAAKDGYYIKQILFPGANTGYGVFFANEDGPRNDLSFEENRRSIVGTSSNYQFPLFVTQPDPSVWEVADEPFVQVVPEFSRRTVAEETLYGGPGGKAVFTITVDNPGFVDILIDLDKNGVYSDGDVIISRELPYDESLGDQQTFTIVWDGNRDDGTTPVPSGTEVKFVSMTTFFPVHFPIYDMEQSLGMIVNHIAPNPTQQEQVMFWDHSALQNINATPPTNSRQFGNLGNTPINQSDVVHVNVTGMSGKANQWWAHGNYGIGYERTMNLWAGGAAETLEEDYTFNWDSSDLGIVKSVDNDSPYVGDIATFTIKVYNHGLQDAQNIEVVDQLPAGLTYVSHDNNEIGSVVVDNATNKVTWTIASMPYQTPVLDNGYTLIIRTLVENSGPYTNGVTVTSPNDPNPDNNDSEVPLTPIACAAGTEQVELTRDVLSNADLPQVGETLFFDDFGTSPLPTAENGYGRMTTPYMPANSFTFGTGNPEAIGDQNNAAFPDLNKAMIENNHYAVVAPGYIQAGWPQGPMYYYFWTPANGAADAMTDYSGEVDGACLVINAGMTLAPFYERKALLQRGAKYRATYKLYVVNAPSQVGIEIKDLNGNLISEEAAVSQEYGNSEFGKWTDVSIDFIVPGEDFCESNEMIISFKNNYGQDHNNDWYVDNIRVEKIEDAPTTVCPPAEDCVTNGVTSVNLNNAYVGTIPKGAELVWYTTPDRQEGTEVENPEEITESTKEGEFYYAFFYDEEGDCYNTDNSTSTVAVLILPQCVSITATDDFYETGKNTPTEGNILDNDYSSRASDELTVTEVIVNGETITIDSEGTEFTTAQGGTAKVYPDGTLEYKPPSGNNGFIDIFEYQICNQDSDCDVAEVQIAVGLCYEEVDGKPFEWTNPQWEYLSPVVDNVVSHTITQPASNYGFVFDIYELDNSFNMEINGINIAVNEIEFQPQDPEVTVETLGANVEFADGTQYTAKYWTTDNQPNIFQMKGTKENPVVRVIISPNGNVSLWGSKVSEGPLFPLRLTENSQGKNYFNKIIWNTDAENTIVVSQHIVNVTIMDGYGYGRNIVDCPNYWYGYDDTDWTKDSNWTDNYVPEAYEDIVFATDENNNGTIHGLSGPGAGKGAAHKDLRLDDADHDFSTEDGGGSSGGRIIKDLINKSDKNLVVTTTNQLIVDGVVHKNDKGTGTIVVEADEEKAIGTLIFKDPDNNQNVAAKVEFINLADECADCGFYKRNWQYFGIPVDGGAFPFNNPLLDGEMVRRWDEPTNGDKWLDITAASPVEEMTPFMGYEITSKETAPKYEFEGTLNVGDKNIILSKTSGVNYSGMNLLSNSYTAAIPIELAAIELGSSLAENTVYLFNRGTRDQWRKTNGGSVPGTAGGQYTAVPVELAGQATLPDRILSMHSFMVNAASDGTQITLKYDQLVKNVADAANNQPAWRSADSNARRELPYIVLDVIGEDSADRVWLFEESSTTRGYDNGWDGHKMMEGDLIQVYATDADQNKYQVTTVPQLDNTTLGIAARENESYTISVSTAADVENRRLYLHDTFTGRGYLLKDGAEMIIPGTRSANQNRFKITASNVPAAVTEASTINTYVRDNVIVVENRSNENATVSVYDISGRFVGKAQIAKDEMKSFPELSIAAGVKVVKVVSDSGAVNCSDRVLLK